MESIVAVDVRRPSASHTGLVFGLPHSGQHLPAEFVAAARYDATHLRMTEDAFVDGLVGFETLEGVWAVRANYGRAYVDVNRHPLELDPRLIRGPLPKGALSQSLRVRSGYGVIPRCLSGGREIHAQPIDYAEAVRRLDRVHKPYHRALTEALAQAKSAHGRVTLIDWHSMPSGTLKQTPGALADIVLGDLHGEACRGDLTAFVRQAFESRGFRVAHNHPFAGGYTLERYAEPFRGVEGLQIEINRGLYMDEVALTLSPKADRMRVAVAAVIEGLKARR
ncbi:N-formylglutamate amidohydrolase [Asticcacaulis sp. AND118]|uniref:N-formylglutamate amidohydrolase n=1 Tax=Asticcacaulis sp. AND118 TaxID=2840468 RepID=UPI001CFF9E37|nr:N-formylglutamate amidohydrolase [Asticcacaulis sp. AND118]UDF03024.1 N-formylglutamate amidohydrolase [Asticcacaulis sp. AND118]